MGRSRHTGYLVKNRKWDFLMTHKQLKVKTELKIGSSEVFFGVSI